MKKLLLSCIMLVSGLNLLGAQTARYQPATGPLSFSDTANAGGNVSARGSIMQTVLNNNPAIAGVNPSLAAANLAIEQFDGHGQNFRSYQDIMTNLRQAVNTTQALAAVSAFETVIMHMYDYRAYLLGSYRSVQSIFVTGIRYPTSWIFDDAELKQLIDELYNLAEIATIHNAIVATKIKATAHSYRYWRRNLAVGALAYLAADMYSQGFDNSIVNIFYEKGLINGFDKIRKNIGSDSKHGVQVGYKYTTWAAKSTWNNIVKPLGTAILYGAKDTKSDNKDSYWNRFKNTIKQTETETTQDEPSKPWHLAAYSKDAWNDYLKTFTKKAA